MRNHEGNTLFIRTNSHIPLLTKIEIIRNAHNNKKDGRKHNTDEIVWKPRTYTKTRQKNRGNQN